MLKLNNAVLESVVGGSSKITRNKIWNKNYSKVIATNNKVRNGSSFDITVVQVIGDTTLEI